MQQREAFLLDRAQRLFRSFLPQKGDNDDTEYHFGLLMAPMLAKYPDDVVEKVTDPYDGLASQQNWRPRSVAELRVACEKLMEPLRKAIELEAKDQAARIQLEERRQADAFAAKTGKSGKVAEYLKGRETEQLGPPMSGEQLLKVYLAQRAMPHGKRVSLSAGARQIILAAGLELPE